MERTTNCLRNRRFLKIMLVTILACGTNLNADAQFFKKLGKAIETAGKTLDALSGEAVEGQVTAAQSGCSVTCKVPNMKIVYKGVTMEGNQQCINFVMTNTGGAAVNVDNFDSMKCFDSEGEEYSSRSVVGKTMTSLGNGNFTFEPGVPVKGKVILIDCPQTVTKMSLVQIRTKMHDRSAGWLDTFIEFRNVDMTQTAAQ